MLLNKNFYYFVLNCALSRFLATSTSVKSCDQLGWLNAETYGDSSICGQSEVLSSCSGLVDYDDAESFCSFVGARLCTVDELINDEARGTGCSIDTKLVWSSTTCEFGTSITLGSTKAGTYTNCSHNDAVHYTKCCADVFSNDNITISTSSCDDLGWDPNENGSPLVCADSEISKQCSGQVSFENAETFCETAGARLCTLDELWANEARATGCSLDSEVVWSSSVCDHGVYVALGGTGSGIYSNCTSTVSPINYARCCADVFNSTSSTSAVDDDIIDDSTDDETEVETSLVNCDGLGWNAVDYGSETVCGGSEAGNICSTELNWNGAESFCESVGARLCTLKELWNDEARASGCALDRSLVWSSTSCGNHSHYITYGSQISSEGTYFNCSTDEFSYFTRCCGDVFDDSTFMPSHSPTTKQYLQSSSSNRGEDEDAGNWETLNFMRGSLRPVLNMVAIFLAATLLLLGCSKYWISQRNRKKYHKKHSDGIIEQL